MNAFTILAMGFADAADAVESFRIATRRNHYPYTPQQYGQSRMCRQEKRRNHRAGKGRK